MKQSTLNRSTDDSLHAPAAAAVNQTTQKEEPEKRHAAREMPCPYQPHINTIQKHE